MKRFHIHVSVKNLDQSIRFYETLFGAAPTIKKDEYAKWQLDDPALNFAISTSTGKVGIDHIGVQASQSHELAEIASRLKTAGAPTFDQEATSCCYALSDKTWVEDPSGVRWETFFTHGEATVYGDDEAHQALAAMKESTAKTEPAPSCCA